MVFPAGVDFFPCDIFLPGVGKHRVLGYSGTGRMVAATDLRSTGRSGFVSDVGAVRAIHSETKIYHVYALG